MSKLFLFVGHPRERSLSHGLADAYQRGAESEGAEVRRMHLHDMAFDQDLTHGYHQRKTLEPCLEAWRENILWAEHLCWAYPIWWGGMPAKMKGLVDRALLPGFAFQYHDNDPFWDRLLAGRSAHVMLTSDTPVWYDAWTNRRPGKLQVERTVLKFCGVKPVTTVQFSPVRDVKETKIQAWMRKAYHLGADAGRR